MALTLPELPYAYDFLQPYMSQETLEFHHDKHHKAYVDKGNELLGEKAPQVSNENFEAEMVKAFNEKNMPLFNQLGQHYNHIHFWKWMKKDGGGAKIPGRLETQIDSDLGGYEAFKKDFIAAGVGQFGSGWAWLALDANGKLEITKTLNGENPLVHGKKPILGVDVWEHSYYIDYRNARPKYLEAFVDNLINWEHVEEMFENATK